MSKKDERTKPKYEAPTVVPLGGLARGAGVATCDTVGSAADTTCTSNGGAALTTCTSNGSLAATTCTSQGSLVKQ
jgi:hypothetical protein